MLFAPPAPGSPVSLSAILSAVSDLTGLDHARLLSAERTKPLAWARFVFVLHAVHLTPHSLTAIGRFLGRRDHSTIVHAAQRARRLRETDPEFRRAFEAVGARLEQQARAA